MNEAHDHALHLVPGRLGRDRIHHLLAIAHLQRTERRGEPPVGIGQRQPDAAGARIDPEHTHAPV